MATLDIDSLSPEQKNMARMVGDAAVDAGIDPDLAIAQAFAESRLNHFVGEGKSRHVIKSDQDAYGVMQITPDLAKAYGYSKEDLLDPMKNVEAYVKIMGQYLNKYKKPDLAVMAYHQGEGPVDKLLETDDTKHIGPKGKQYVLSIGDIYDLENKSGLFEDDTKFDDLGALPSDIDSVNKFNRPGIIEITAKYIKDKPVESGLIASPATAFLQSRLNKGLVNDAKQAENLKNQVAMLEEQFKLQQAQQPQTAGDKWATKVTGSMGPGGESVTEAARNYRMQQGLSPTESARFKVGREGLILPNEIQRQIDEAVKNESIMQRSLGAAKAQRDLINRGLFNIGKSPLATGASTALTGVYANEARERELAGDELGAAMSKMKAISSGLGAIPMSPRYRPLMYLKGAGMGATGGLQALDYLREKYFPRKSVTETPK